MSASGECRRCGRVAELGERGECSRCAASAALLSESGRSGAPPTVSATFAGSGEGEVFGDYLLLEELGRGGMGHVFKARHRRLGRVVALKLLLPDLSRDLDRVRMFQLEAEAIANLAHPGIVGLYEAGQTGDRPYLAMEFVEGGNLAEAARRERLDFDTCARLMEQVARAIHHAHQRGVLHRDLKPSNILLGADGVPKVADFGISKILGREGQATAAGIGTPEYMAPEQVHRTGADLSVATDIYSLGAVLYHLLTGRPPFHHESVEKLLWSVYYSAPEPPRQLRRGLPESLELICLKCLEKEPSRRYGSAGDLADDLGRFLRREPVLAKPVGRVTRCVMWSQRNPLLALSWALVIVAAAAGVTAQQLALRDARAGRTELESLIGFMNVDLANRLEDLGRLDLMGRICEETERYYHSHESLRDHAFLERKAVFYENFANVEMNQGDFVAAAAHAGLAVEIHLGLARGEVEPKRRVFAGARALISRAEAERKAGLELAATTHASESLSMVEPFLGAKNLDGEMRRWGGEILLVNADMAIERRRLSRASRLTERAEALLLPLRGKAGKGGVVLATCGYYRGLIAKSKSDHARALAEFTAYLASIDALMALHPGDLKIKFEKVVASGRVAESLFDLNNLPQAVIYARQYEEAAERLVVEDPRNARWQFAKARALAWKGLLAVRQERYESGVGSLGAAGDILRRLTGRNPEWDEAAQELSRVEVELAWASLKSGAVESGAAVLRDSRLRCREIALRQPGRFMAQRRWGDAVVEEAEYLGKHVGANAKMEAFQAGLRDLLEAGLGQPATPGRLLCLGRIYARMANAEHGRSNAPEAARLLELSLRRRLEASRSLAGDLSVQVEIGSSYRWLVNYLIESGQGPAAVGTAEEMLEWAAAQGFLSAGAEDLMDTLRDLRAAGLKVDPARVPRLRTALTESPGEDAAENGNGLENPRQKLEMLLN